MSTTKILALAAAAAPFTPAMASGHLPANHCEIFVDRIGISSSSHGSVIVTFFIKTLNERLDAPIAEVGVRTAETVRTVHDGTTVGSWYDLGGSSFAGASDYFQVSQLLGSEYALSRFQTSPPNVWWFHAACVIGGSCTGSIT